MFVRDEGAKQKSDNRLAGNLWKEASQRATRLIVTRFDP